MATNREPPALQHFLSLRAAAAIAYTAATGKRTSSVATLNAVARIVASRVRVFVQLPDGEAVRVLPLELAEGALEAGGDQLRFADKRPTLIGLQILHKDLAMAISEVNSSYKRNHG